MKSLTKYDYVFITNIPAFYKIKLFNEINKYRKVYVIFLNSSEHNRTKDFYDEEICFSYSILDQSEFFNRVRILICLLIRRPFERIFYCGWDKLIYYIMAIGTRKARSAIIVESSICESNIKGLYKMLKRVILRNVGFAYVPGIQQKRLLEQLGYHGETILTKGVGLFNLLRMPKSIPKNEVKNFLFIGRFAPEKNLLFLIEVFNNLPNLQLTLIGDGPLKEEILQIRGNNVKLIDYVPNKELFRYYRANDVFLLPSVSEPWGLVVEEALSNCLPVIVSNKVGCIGTLVINKFNGLVFDYQSKNSLLDCIKYICVPNNYNGLRDNIERMDFYELQQEQIRSYL